ncbi:MAG: 2Fe-2S iron-sulfur cluster-binding protein, partial [Thermoplasmatota archaeon]
MEGTMVKVRIDGKEFDVPREKNMFSFFQENGLAVPGMCFQSEGDPYGACRLCLVTVDGKLQTACTVQPSEAMEIETLSPTAVVMRRTALELMLSDHRGDCIAPCREGCPAHSDVQGYVALIAMGRYHEAVRLMKERYILPAVLGRVCPAFCEDECRRHVVDQPVAIRAVKRFAADYDLECGPWMPDVPVATGKKVGVVGGG